MQSPKQLAAVFCFSCRKDFERCSCHTSADQPSWHKELLTIQRRLKGTANMRFSYGKDLYSIEFAYNKVLCTYYRKGKKIEALSKFPAITATILRLDVTQAGLKNAEVVASDTARHHYKDQYVPETGRRTALRFLCSKKNSDSGRVPKDMRFLIWQAYFNRGNTSAPIPSNPTPAPALPPLEVEVEQREWERTNQADLEVLVGNFNIVH